MNAKDLEELIQDFEPSDQHFESENDNQDANITGYLNSKAWQNFLKSKYMVNAYKHYEKS